MALSKGGLYSSKGDGNEKKRLISLTEEGERGMRDEELERKYLNCAYSVDLHNFDFVT